MKISKEMERNGVMNWNQWSPDDWSQNDGSWDDIEWNSEWIASLDDWSGDRSWSDDDWRYWPEDWSWNTQDRWTPEVQQSSNGAASSGANVPQDTAKNEPPPNVSAVTVEPSDQSAPGAAKTVRGAKPGLMTNLFVFVDRRSEFRSAT